MISPPMNTSVSESGSGKSLDASSKSLDAALCAISLKHFAANHVMIQNQNTNRVEQWQSWPYLLDLIDIILNYDVIYILKASQLGISWLMGIYNLWVAIFNETAKCLLLSQGQAEAYDLLAKCSFIFDHLPGYLKVPIQRDNRELIKFQNTRAEIKALPSTEKAGHGYQASVVTRDELARHEYARENFRAVSRAIDSGGKLIELSTANKQDNDNYFSEKTQDFLNLEGTVKKTLPSGVDLFANPKRPGTCMVFLSWKLRPVRYEGLTLDEWWNSRILTKYTPLEIDEQYPSCVEDVFKPSLTMSYFDALALEEMGFQVMPPINQQEISTFNSVVRVYKLPIKGRRYVLFTDPSDGVSDPFVTGVMDFVTGEVVASASGKIKVDAVAEIHDYLSRTYDAINSYEYTGSAGGTFAKCLETFQTPKQAMRRKPDGKIEIGKKGQWVSTESKRIMFSDLGLGVTKRQIVCHDREFMQQAKLVTRNGTDPVTERKLSFDWVMMMAGLWQLQKWIPRGTYSAWTVR